MLNTHFMRNFIFFLFFISCSPYREQSVQFRNLEQDFPDSETLICEEIGQYELFDYRNIVIKDSILFVLEQNATNFGRCFNINTGKEINSLVAKGRANNEMGHVDNYMLLGDSLQAISGNRPYGLKLYAIDDILKGTVNSPREFVIPDSLSSFTMELIDNNTLFGIPDHVDASIDAKYFLFDGHQVEYIGKSNKELIESNIELNNVDMRYSNSIRFDRHDNKLIVGICGALQFETIDIKERNINKRCYYNKVKIEIIKEGYTTVWNGKSDHSISQIGCNNEYIYAVCVKVISEDVFDFFILKFDWELNPIKKYDIEDNSLTFTFSENSDYLYCIEDNSTKECQILKRYKL